MITLDDYLSEQNHLIKMMRMLEIPTLNETIDRGRLVDVVSPQNLLAYTAVAMVRVAHDCPPGADELADEMACRLIVIFTADPGDTHRLRVDELGRLYLVHEVGEVEVTDDRVRHWEWLLEIFRFPEAAQRLIDAVPDGIRDRAERDLEQRRGMNASFDAIVAGTTSSPDPTTRDESGPRLRSGAVARPRSSRKPASES